MLNKLKPNLIYLPTAVTFALITGFFALWQYQSSREDSYIDDRITDEAKRVELEISETIKQTAQALSRYAARIELLGYSNKEYLELDSKAYLTQLPILKRIGLIDSSNHVFWSYPPELSDQVQGFDQSKDPNRLAALDQARESRTPAFSRAVELRSGGRGFLLPTALYPKGKFAGFAYATIEANKLFHSFVPARDFQVSIIEDGRTIFESAATSPLVFKLTQTHGISAGKSAWILKITPTENFLKNARSEMPFWIFIFGVFVSFVIGALLQKVVRSRRDAIANGEWRKALINSSDYAIISTDADGTIRTFNHAATKMLGYKSAELIGKFTPKIFHLKEEGIAHAAILTAELGRKIEPGFEAYTAKAKALRVADENEWTFVRKDGSQFPAILSVTAVFDASEKVIGYLGICSDLTEKKKIEEQLTSTSERLKRVVEATEEGIWEREFIPGGKIRFIDSQAKRIFGFRDDENPTYEEVVAKFAADDMSETAQKLQFHVDNDTAGFDLEIALNLKGPKTRWIRARGKIVRSTLSVPLLVSTIKDVTEEVAKRSKLKAALAAAEDATKAKSEFLANMSHEIRTPLNGVIGMTGLLLDCELKSIERGFAETIRSSAEILLSLINDILDFSKIEARKLDLEIIDFDLEETIQNIERLLSFSAQKKGIRIVHSVSTDLPAKIFRGDPNRIGQILANLIGNAVKFTERGEVVVRVTTERDSTVPSNEASRKRARLRIEVEDTGIGISEVAQKKMFQPFTQLDASTTRRFGGTGLGLSICRHLTEMMGGKIGVRSKDGVGSTFWFTLELEIGSQHQTAPSSTQNAALPDIPLRGLRILLAEDNTVNQLIATKMLEKHGASVDIVVNGNEAVDALNGAPYDLILMDCQMPDLDGYETTSRIRSGTVSGFASIPIVALTANAMLDDREKCIQVGMDDYVTKPIRANELVKVILNVLGKRPSNSSKSIA